MISLSLFEPFFQLIDLLTFFAYYLFIKFFFVEGLFIELMVSVLLLLKIIYFVSEEGKVIEAQVMRLEPWRLQAFYLIYGVHAILDLH